MGFRFRIGPFTFGRSGTRLSLWNHGTGISIPLNGDKSSIFGKIKIGPLSYYFNGVKEKSKKNTEKDIQNLNSYENTAIEIIAKDKIFIKKLISDGLPWRGIQERIKEELPMDLNDRDKIAYNLVSKCMKIIFGKQNSKWSTEKRASKSGTGFTTWVVIK
jgi:hypothetical protein